MRRATKTAQYGFAIAPYESANLLLQQPPIARDRGVHAGEAERAPHHGGGGGNRRLAQVALERLQDGDRRHPAAAEKPRLDVVPEDCAAEPVGALRRLLVDVAHVLKPAVTHNGKAVDRKSTRLNSSHI